ncbi:hypothetical protein IGL98_002861 [Enterococcus sp. DIV0840]|uniref:GNAT family N-acetyltransferase n=1 Tax=unclassified Enterococcus TaxID=2608891 RepID=UPI001A8F28B2|nr:GNAT family N-acetyltransferase [Enterococcus sp. DIV0849a]
MKKKISLVDRTQLSDYEKNSIFRLLLTSFSAKFASLRLTSKEKLDILLYLEQKYSTQEKALVDYLVKDGEEVIGILTVSDKIVAPKNLNYPFELSKRYGLFTILKYVILLTSLEYQAHEKERYIENIAVHEQYQKQGIAKALITAAQSEVENGDRLSLIVSAKNQQALRLYLKCGFSIVKKKRNFILGLLANEPNWIFMEWSR